MEEPTWLQVKNLAGFGDENARMGSMTNPARFAKRAGFGRARVSACDQRQLGAEDGQRRTEQQRIRQRQRPRVAAAGDEGRGAGVDQADAAEQALAEQAERVDLQRVDLAGAQLRGGEWAALSRKRVTLQAMGSPAFVALELLS